MSLLNIGISVVFGFYVGTLIQQEVLTLGQAAALMGLYILRVCTSTTLRTPDNTKGSAKS